MPIGSLISDDNPTLNLAFGDDPYEPIGRGSLRPTPRAPRLSRIALFVWLYAGMAIVAAIWSALRGHPNVLVDADAPPFSIARCAAGITSGIAAGVAFVLLSRLSVQRFAWARTLHHEFRHLLGPLSGREVFLIAAASSIGEELLFRGAMIPQLGLILSSALFAIPHIGPGLRFLPWTLSSLVAGFAFGGLFLAFGDVGGPIAAHFTINFLNLRFIQRHDPT